MKLTPTRILLLVAILFINFFSCAKKNDTCWKCEAKCGSSEQVEQTICSSSEETQFRGTYSDCSVECNH